MPLSPEKQMLMGALPIEKRHAIFRQEAIAATRQVMRVFAIPQRFGIAEDQDRQELFTLHFAGYYLTKRNAEPNRNIRETQATHPPFPIPIFDQFISRAESVQTETEKVSRDLQEQAFQVADRVRETTLLHAKSFISETREMQAILAGERDGSLAERVDECYQTMLVAERTPEEIRAAANLISSAYWQMEGLSFEEWFNQLDEVIDTSTQKRTTFPKR